jgi:hypothetical protein
VWIVGDGWEDASSVSTELLGDVALVGEWNNRR